LLVDIVANLIVSRIFHALQDILDFFQMITIVGIGIGRRRIQSGIDLNLDDVTEIILWIKVPLA
jgi:hypothetical protein